jgi:hypothetical protein
MWLRARKFLQQRVVNPSLYGCGIGKQSVTKAAMCWPSAASAAPIGRAYGVAGLGGRACRFVDVSDRSAEGWL